MSAQSSVTSRASNGRAVAARPSATPPASSDRREPVRVPRAASAIAIVRAAAVNAYAIGSAVCTTTSGENARNAAARRAVATSSNNSRARRYTPITQAAATSAGATIIVPNSSWDAASIAGQPGRYLVNTRPSWTPVSQGRKNGSARF
ncbi:hypothetical protein [Candidatus Frankia meridionalis]|uniref:hypothetical protein n=2 Tax=Frankiaceae TaxID=74712 RepID=UPI0006802C53